MIDSCLQIAQLAILEFRVWRFRDNFFQKFTIHRSFSYQTVWENFGREKWDSVHCVLDPLRENHEWSSTRHLLCTCHAMTYLSIIIIHFSMFVKLGLLLKERCLKLIRCLWEQVIIINISNHLGSKCSLFRTITTVTARGRRYIQYRSVINNYLK